MYKDFGVMTFQPKMKSRITSPLARLRGALPSRQPPVLVCAENRSDGTCRGRRDSSGHLRHPARWPSRLADKTEQADLLQALFAATPKRDSRARASLRRLLLGRHRTSRIAVKYMVPVIILSDGYLANGAERGEFRSK